MNKIRDLLWNNLPEEKRKNMNSHLNSMQQNIKYLKENDDPSLHKAFKFGWSLQQLEIICILVIFNHYIIAPLMLGSKTFQTTRINEVSSIQHGKLKLDEKFSAKLSETCRVYYSIVADLGINNATLASLNFKDLLFHLTRTEEDDE